MVYVKRDQHNNIVAIFDKNTDKKLDEVASDDKDLIAFLARCELEKKSSFLKADLDLIRVIEDLIQILIAKNVISITDFPISAIEKLVVRNKIREQYKGISGIMDKI